MVMQLLDYVTLNSPWTSAANMDEQDDVAHLLTVSFNQDAKSLGIGHKDGYQLHNTLDVLEEKMEPLSAETIPVLQEAIIVERLFNSSLVVVVSQKEPRVMHVYHFNSKNMICNHRFTKSILNVKLNRERVAVCLEDCIHVYNLKDMKLVHSIQEIPLNRLGLMDLSVESAGFLAYPGSAEVGSVNIFNASVYNAVSNFAAHNGPIAALKFNSTGTMLATASTKGTVIRVFSVPKGEKLFEFRRGMSRCVNIYSLAFSEDSKYLCSSSNTETVHVFKLDKQPDEKKPESGTGESSGWYDYLVNTAASYMPSQVSIASSYVNDLVYLDRSFAIARLPGNDKRAYVAMPTIKGQQHVLVATTDGFLYCYTLESEGGDCNLIKQIRLIPKVGNDSVKSPRADDLGAVPNPDDAGEFPPIAHSSG